MLRSPTFLLLCCLAQSQAQSTQLPDAPAPRKDVIKPFSLSVGIAERWHNNPYAPHGEDFMLTTGIDYRLPFNRVRVGVGYGYNPVNEASSVTGSVTFKALEWGRRR